MASFPNHIPVLLLINPSLNQTKTIQKPSVVGQSPHFLAAYFGEIAVSF